MVSLENLTSSISVKSMTFAGKPLGVFMYQAKPTALIGIDLKKTPGTYPFVAELSDGKKITKNIEVISRKKIEAPLGIPASLGGNTPAAATSLVTNLSKENTELASIWTGTKAFWTEKFRFPLPTIFITDPYGYSRETGSYEIAHKGTDFRAAEGTQVRAMNRGVVRIAKKFTVYGNTIVVDHGFGLMTMYMHLSKINVNPGELVLLGQVIGLSGHTGYAESAHLHVSVRIDGISIDPMKFMDLFK